MTAQQPDPATTGAVSQAAGAVVVGSVTPREAAGPSYAGEWGLFCDYATASAQPALPTTVAALTGFLTALPAHPATLARRIRAIATAHRRAGYLLDRPDSGPAAPPPPRPRRPRWTEPAPMIAACPTRGWPHGLHGRRDAFLVVLIAELALSYPAAQALTPAAIGAGEVVTIEGRVIPSGTDPRSCPACAVVRWLDILGTLDGLGRGSARMELVAAHAPTTDTSHAHRTRAPHRWRDAATLLPAIDQHGWLDDYRPITARTVRTRLARAAARSAEPVLGGETPPDPSPVRARSEGPPTMPTAPTLDEVLALLDDVADDADALNARIQALLDIDHGPVAPLTDTPPERSG